MIVESYFAPSDHFLAALDEIDQPHFGGLPLILLGERLGFIDGVIAEVCENPGDRRPIKVLHRLLQFYADMARARREADRRRKRPKVRNA